MIAYAELEASVQRVIASLTGRTCALCTSTCCTPNICEESMDSAFLREMHAQFQPKILFCDRYGWLTEIGCGLKCGRPPVCYGFFCDEIFDSFDERHQQLLRKLGRLVSRVGEKALGRRHLVEIMDTDELQKINCDRLAQRIAVAQTELESISNQIRVFSA